MFYNEDELASLGLKSYGKNVLISKLASIYNPNEIKIGDNVRIDDFCILSAGPGKIEIGSHVHIACYCLLVGKENITLCDYSGLSSRVSIYSSTDDYSGNYLTNPMTPDIYRNVISKPVYLGKYVIVGASSVILPGVRLEEGVAVGSMSLVTKSFPEYKVLFGVPAKVLKNRSQKIKSF